MKAKINPNQQIFKACTLELTAEEVQIFMQNVGPSTEAERAKLFGEDCAKLLGEMWHVIDDEHDREAGVVS